MLTLRPFQPEDDAALISWLRTPEELVLFTGPVLSWPLDSAQLDGLRANPQFSPFTAVDDTGTPVGHVELVSTGDDSARIGRVLVDPARQGQGLGELVVRAAIAEAWDRGIRSLALFVFPENTRAVRLYEKLGFVHRGPSEQLSGSLLMELRP